MTACILLDIGFTRFSQYSGVISVIQTSLITLTRSARDAGCLSATFLLRIIQQFSVTLRSGLLPGQSKTLMFFSESHVFTIFAVWTGAPSCWKMSQPKMVMDGSSFSFRISRYTFEVMVVFLGMIYSEPLPFPDMHPHTTAFWCNIPYFLPGL